jgi:hypothetical protein
MEQDEVINYACLLIFFQLYLDLMIYFILIQKAIFILINQRINFLMNLLNLISRVCILFIFVKMFDAI